MSKQILKSKWTLENTQKYKELQKLIKINKAEAKKAFIKKHQEAEWLIKELDDSTEKAAQKVIECYIERYSKGYPQYAGHLKLLAKDPYDLNIKSGNELLSIFIKRGNDIKSSEVQVRKDLINKNRESEELLKELYTLLDNTEKMTTLGYMKANPVFANVMAFKGTFEQEGNDTPNPQSQKELAKAYMEKGQKIFMFSAEKDAVMGSDNHHSTVGLKHSNNHIYHEVESLGLDYFPV